jgi:hypothetical protein
MRLPFGAGVVGAVEVSGAVAPGCTAAAGEPVVFAARPAAARLEDRWAAVLRWVRPEVRQYAARGVPAPLWARPGVRQYVVRGVPGLL